MDEQRLLQLPVFLAENLDYGWTFILLTVRFGSLFVLLPGLSGGQQGMAVRFPGILMLSLAAMSAAHPIALPDHLGMLVLQLISEVLFGTAIGFLPMLIIAGVQTGGQLASTSMGLGAGQLMDPTLQTTTTQLARILSDILVISFLLMDGHHIMLYAAGGMGDQIVPGSFVLGVNSLDVLVKQSSVAFELAVLVSAPVVVAILMTQFILGICTKLVSQLNIFIISFPLTIGLGLILSAIVFPMFLSVGNRYLGELDSLLVDIISDTQLREQP